MSDFRVPRRLPNLLGRQLWWDDFPDATDEEIETIRLLRSIQKCMIFFLALAVIGIIVGIIATASISDAAGNYSGGPTTGVVPSRGETIDHRAT